MSALMRSELVALSGDGRFVAIRNPDGLRVVDAVARELLHEIETGELHAFAMVQQQLWVAHDDAIDCYALPSLDPFALDAAVGPGFFTASPSGRAIVFAGGEALLLGEENGGLAARALTLPEDGEVAAVTDAGHVWARAGNDLVLVDGAGGTLATVQFADTERLVGAAVLSSRPALVALLREEGHDTLLTLDAGGERLTRARLPPVELMRVADKRLLAVLATGPRSLSALDLRYCRTVASTETASDVADIACSADAASFVVAGVPTAPGEFQVRQLAYREMFQPQWPGQDELLRTDRRAPAAPQRPVTAAARPVGGGFGARASSPPRDGSAAGARGAAPPAQASPPPRPRLESVPIAGNDGARAQPDEANASEGELPRLIAYARRLLAGEKQPRRLSHSGLDALMERYALDELDGALVVLAAAPHLEPALRDDVARARGDNDQIDAALALKLAAGAHLVAERLDRFAESAPLIRHGLLRLLPPPLARAASLAEHELVPSGRVLSALRGSDEIDPLLAPLAELHDCADDDAAGIVTPDERERLSQLLGAALGAGTHALVIVPSELGSRRLMRGLAAALGHQQILTTDVALLPTDVLPLCEALTELAHEAAHRDVPLVVEHVSAWRHEELLVDRLRAALRRLPLPVWATSDHQVPALDNSFPLRLTVSAPDEPARADGWRIETTRAKIALTQAQLDELAQRPLARAQIGEACLLAAALAANANEPATLTHLARALDALYPAGDA